MGINRLHTDHISRFLGNFIALYTFSATSLNHKFFQSRTLSKAIFRNNKKSLSLGIQLHTNNLIIQIQIHTDHTHRCPSCRAHIGFIKPNTHTIFRNKKNIIGIGCGFNLNQLIIFPEINGCKTGFSNILIFRQRGLFHHTILCRHKQIGILIISFNRNHGCNPLPGFQLK